MEYLHILVKPLMSFPWLSHSIVTVKTRNHYAQQQKCYKAFTKRNRTGTIGGNPADCPYTVRLRHNGEYLRAFGLCIQALVCGGDVERYANAWFVIGCKEQHSQELYDVRYQKRLQEKREFTERKKAGLLTPEEVEADNLRRAKNRAWQKEWRQNRKAILLTVASE